MSLLPRHLEERERKWLTYSHCVISLILPTRDNDGDGEICNSLPDRTLLSCVLQDAFRSRMAVHPQQGPVLLLGHGRQGA